MWLQDHSAWLPWPTPSMIKKQLNCCWEKSDRQNLTTYIDDKVENELIEEYVDMWLVFNDGNINITTTLQSFLMVYPALTAGSS